MTEDRDESLQSWLACQPDEYLIRLLELRPDLAQPLPGSVAALAGRAGGRQSVRAATDDLDFLRLAVLDALLTLGADTAATPLTKLTALIAGTAGTQALTAALADLTERALCWGDHTAIRVVAEAGGGLPWHPGQVTLEDDSIDLEQVLAALSELGDIERGLLDKLLTGSPLGRTRDAAPGAPAHLPVPRLLAAGLLRRIDDQTVILPRLVGQVLRGEQPGPTGLVAPDPVITTTSLGDVDSAAGGEVIELLHDLDTVLDALGRTPVAELRAGGMGVREVRRLVKVTGVDEPRLGLLLELAASAGLIGSGFPSVESGDAQLDAAVIGDGPHWAPTVAADRFTELTPPQRWRLLATTWLELPSRPGLIGTREPDGKPRAALSPMLYSTAAPLDRRLMLTLLAELPEGGGVDADTASLALVWRRPRWSRRLAPGPVRELLDEASALGLLGRGALSSAGRTLLAHASDGDDDPALLAAMQRSLPDPIDHFLVQADLTVVVPGPLRRELADELGAVAEVESAGTAMVYRVSEQTIRNALDIGRTAAGLHEFFAKHSRTPVPQGLDYLIDDVARRHGRLRVGFAMSFVRCEDPALLTQALALSAAETLGLRALAPTVAVAQAPLADVLAVLRDAGLAPVAEDPEGRIVDIRPREARLAASIANRRRRYRDVLIPDRESLTALVKVLRRSPTVASGTEPLDPVMSARLLAEAIRDGAAVFIGYADPAGVTTRRVVTPISVRGPTLSAFDTTAGRPREFALRRITSIAVTGDDWASDG